MFTYAKRPAKVQSDTAVRTKTTAFRRPTRDEVSMQRRLAPAGDEMAPLRRALVQHASRVGLGSERLPRQIHAVGEEIPESSDEVLRKARPTPGSGGAPAAAPVPAAVPPHPTGIASTEVASTLNFGATYRHTFNSSTGQAANLSGVTVGEHVTVARDDFGLGWGGVPLGAIKAPCKARGQISDSIGTPAGAIRPKLARMASFPAVLDTPQTLHWQNGVRWNQFASVSILFQVHRRADGNMEAETRDNGVSVFQAV